MIDFNKYTVELKNSLDLTEGERLQVYGILAFSLAILAVSASSHLGAWSLSFNLPSYALILLWLRNRRKKREVNSYDSWGTGSTLLSWWGLPLVIFLVHTTLEIAGGFLTMLGISYSWGIMGIVGLFEISLLVMFLKTKSPGKELTMEDLYFPKAGIDEGILYRDKSTFDMNRLISSTGGIQTMSLTKEGLYKKSTIQFGTYYEGLLAFCYPMVGYWSNYKVAWKVDLPLDFLKGDCCYKLIYSQQGLGVHGVKDSFGRNDRIFHTPGVLGYDGTKDIPALYLTTEHILKIFAGFDEKNIDEPRLLGMKVEVVRSIESYEFFTQEITPPRYYRYKYLNKAHLVRPSWNWPTGLPTSVPLKGDHALNSTIKIKIQKDFLPVLEHIALHGNMDNETAERLLPKS